MKDYSAITLTAGACELELVPEFGGLSNKLKMAVPGKPVMELIAGLPDRQAMESDGGFRGIPLFPVVNRLDGGAYQYRGADYQLEVNETALNNTLHGFIHHIKPTAKVIEQGAEQSSACLHYAYDGSLKGYPFAVDIKMTYTLNSDGSLVIEFEVTNNHHEPIPVGLGWHPYFQLGEKVDDLSLQLPSVSHTQVNERMLPTGIKTSFNEFEELKAIGSKQFDDCFELASSDAKVSTVLWSQKAQCGFELWQKTGENGFNFIQVCIPPDRQSIAIEPVSCGINAFNTQEGLIHLAPNSTFRTECGVKCI